MGENGYYDMLLDDRERKQEEFLMFLKIKFGNIVNELIPNLKNEQYPERLEIDISKRMPKCKNSYINNLVLETIRKNALDKEFIKSFIDNGVDFAFDFPGWFGSLDFSKDNSIKEVMIVQAEPHIENYNYQVTYEFAEKEYGKDIKIENEKITSEFFSKNNLFNSLTTLFLNNTQKDKIFKDKDRIELYKFLEMFYITDACHFCPQTTVTELKKRQKEWNVIRDKIGKSYLSQEIELINPKLILVGGGDAMKTISNSIPDIENVPFNIAKEYNSSALQPNLYKYKVKQGVHIGKSRLILNVPHIGTRNLYPNSKEIINNLNLNLEIEKILNED